MSDLHRVAAACNRFAFRVHAEAAKSAAGNFVMGTSSVASAVAAAWPAAGGRTAAEIDKALGGIGEKTFLPTLRRLSTAPRPEGVDLRLHTRLWCDERIRFREEFLDYSLAVLGASAERLRFADAADAAERMNAAVAVDTMGRITDLVSPMLLDPDSRLIITNAASLDAAWSSPFEDRDTTDRPFRLASGRSIPVPMMTQRSHFRVAEERGYRSLAMEYGHLGLMEAGVEGAVEPVGLEMLILLPDRPERFDRVEKQLLRGEFDGQLGAGETQDVVLSLPRFDFASDASLSHPLRKSGLKTFLDPERSDFTGATDDPDGLAVSECLHKARIRVDESGTEAAAATAIVMFAAGAAAPPPPPVEFTVDRPFQFLIREPETGLVHFLGRVTDPTAGG